MEIVLNKCYGGFSPSMLAYKEYLKLKGKKAFFYNQTKYKFNKDDGKDEYSRIEAEPCNNDMFYCYTKDLGKTISKLPNKGMVYLRDYNLRIDKNFIKVVKRLGDKVNTHVSDIKIIEIPDGIEWEIDEYDGIETIHEKHRSW